MTEEKTLGQVNHDAWHNAYLSDIGSKLIGCSFDRRAPEYQAAFEAAASAVREKVRRETIEECAVLLATLADNPQELRLCLGEMSAPEMRTLMAGLRMSTFKIRESRHVKASTSGDRTASPNEQTVLKQ